MDANEGETCDGESPISNDSSINYLKESPFNYKILPAAYTFPPPKCNSFSISRSVKIKILNGDIIPSINNIQEEIELNQSITQSIEKMEESIRPLYHYTFSNPSEGGNFNFFTSNSDTVQEEQEQEQEKQEKQEHELYTIENNSTKTITRNIIKIKKDEKKYIKQRKKITTRKNKTKPKRKRKNFQEQKKKVEKKHQKERENDKEFDTDSTSNSDNERFFVASLLNAVSKRSKEDSQRYDVILFIFLVVQQETDDLFFILSVLFNIIKRMLNDPFVRYGLGYESNDESKCTIERFKTVKLRMERIDKRTKSGPIPSLYPSKTKRRSKNTYSLRDKSSSSSNNLLQRQERQERIESRLRYENQIHSRNISRIPKKKWKMEKETKKYIHVSPAVLTHYKEKRSDENSKEIFNVIKENQTSTPNSVSQSETSNNILMNNGNKVNKLCQEEHGSYLTINKSLFIMKKKRNAKEESLNDMLH